MQETLNSMTNSVRGEKLIGVKIDVERAYDRMSRDFVELVLLRFGFHRRFVSWVMGCVWEPFFGFLIKGLPTEWFS